MASWQEIFFAFFKLGLTSFGGPVAHLGYFRTEFVERRKWLDDRAYGEVVAMAQFLPGPSSSQVGMAIGLMRAGFAGLFAAWLGFTLPSVLLLVGFAMGTAALSASWMAGLTHGLMIVAVAVVAQAVLQMARTLAPDWPRGLLVLSAFGVLLAVPSIVVQMLVLLAGGVLGALFLTGKVDQDHVPLVVPVSRRLAISLIAVFFMLLVALPFAAAMAADQSLLVLADIFYRAGALVFGGGHVVLPILEAELVPQGLIGRDLFLAGYGAAQAVPGPLFSFAGFVGWVSGQGGVVPALICLVAMFGSSFLLVPGVMPFWALLARWRHARAGLMGVNAAVVGLLAAALVSPIATTALLAPVDAVMALAAFALLLWTRLPVWMIVAACAALGAFWL